MDLRMNKRIVLALAAGLTLAGGGAFAQAPAPAARVRATIEKVDGNTLTLKARDGQEIVVMLAADAKVIGVSKAKVADIKPGSFIGSAAIPGPDGTLKALEVTVFPPSMNGTGEGHYGWDLGSNSTMTNGTVGDLVVSDGRTMTVKYSNGGEKKIVVPDDVPIVSLEPADRTLLVAGAHVLVVPMKGADGMLTASRINVGVNGTVPPM
jgi:hypothetical protein